MDFNFGPAVPFRAGSSSANEERLARELARAEEKAARAKSELGIEKRRVEIARSLFNAVNAKMARQAPMDESAYDDLVNIQARLDASEKSNKELREQVSGLSAETTKQDAIINAKDAELTRQQSQIGDLKASNHALKEDVHQEKQAHIEIDNHLQNAYADFNSIQQELKTTTKAKDDAESEREEMRIEIQSSLRHIEQKDEQIRELQAELEEAKERAEDFQAYENELEDLRNEKSDNDRTMQVKDTRIMWLETQFQKALAGKISAEEAARSAAAAASNDEPLALASTNETLQEELEALSDTGSEFQVLEQTDITTVANIAPFEPKLSSPAIQSISVTPVAVQTATSSVQTETPELGLDVVLYDPVSTVPTETKNERIDSAAQTNISGKAKAITVFDVSPSMPESVRLSTTGPDVSTQTEPRRIVSTPKGKRSLSLYQTLAFVLAFICFVLFMQLQAYQTAHRSGYRPRYSSTNGAFGQGRYFLGFVPVGFDIGHDWLSETICRQTSSAIASFESWAGVTPTPLY